MSNEVEAKKYMNLPYTVVLKTDDEGDIVARVQELAGCIAHGDTVEKALKRLREFQLAWIETALDSGEPIPTPELETEGLPSGKWLQRVPRSLHQRLTRRAKQEGVSLNHFVATILAEALGQRAGRSSSRVDSWTWAESEVAEAASSGWHVAHTRYRVPTDRRFVLEFVRQLAGSGRGLWSPPLDEPETETLEGKHHAH
jgi:antitoxin HicB